jgi:hypothetical protein
MEDHTVGPLGLTVALWRVIRNAKPVHDLSDEFHDLSS